MSLKITHKNSTSAGTPPAAGDIDVGEIAINAADAELYTKDNAGNIRKFQNTTTGNAGGVQFTQAGSGATTRTVESKLRDVVSVKDFGAVGDGVADDTAAFNNALAASRYVNVPSGTYVLKSTITLNQFGHSLIGTGGKNTTVLLIDHTTGPGVTIAQGQCVLQGLTITASDTRRNFTAGATYDLASDLFGVKLYNSSGYLTQCLLDRISVQRHPNHGIYMGGEGAGTTFSLCESQYNRGHGYAFDDRTIGGGTSSRCGIVNIESCRAIDNGGNAVHLSQNGSTCYRFIINNLETIWNAWNTSIAGLVNAEVYLSGQNNKLQQSAFGDLDGDARTVMSNGDARLAKTGNLSTGVYIRGIASEIILENCRYISLYRGVSTGTNISYLRVLGAYFTQQKVGGGYSNVNRGFDIGTGSNDIAVDAVNPGSGVVDTWIYDADSNIRQGINSTLTGTFTPTITFATPGDLTVAYAAQTGSYSIVGNLLYVNVSVTFTPTYTTASGVFLVNNLDSIPGVVLSNSSAGLAVSNLFRVSYGLSSVDFVTARVNSTSSVRLEGIITAASPVSLDTTHFPSGTFNILVGFSGVIPLSSRT